MQNLILALTVAAGMHQRVNDMTPMPPDFEATIEVGGVELPKLRFLERTDSMGPILGNMTSQTLHATRAANDWRVQHYASGRVEGLQLRVTGRNDVAGNRLDIPERRDDLVSLVYRVNGVEKSLAASRAFTDGNRDVATWHVGAADLLLLGKAEWIFVQCESNGLARARSIRLDLDRDERAALRWFTYHHAPGGKLAHRLAQILEAPDPLRALVTEVKLALEKLVGFDAGRGLTIAVGGAQ